MVQQAVVDAQNLCRLYRVNLFTYAISSNYDLYGETYNLLHLPKCMFCGRNPYSLVMLKSLSLSSDREWKMQREKVDFLLAVGEKLCRITGAESTENLARATSGDNREPSTNDRRWDDAPEEYLAIIADMVRDHP